VNEFERQLRENLVFLQRYVYFKINHKYDAEDVIQEVCLTATEKYQSLKDPSVFKAWLIGIANHKCCDYYRRKAKNKSLSLDSLSETVLVTGKLGMDEQSAVWDTLETLEKKDEEILRLYFFNNMPQDKIARQLSLPLGTVKSRLHYAKEKFKAYYPYQKTSKGEREMKRLPDHLPKYEIEASNLPPFPVKCEELMGFCIVPRLKERVLWGSYDLPSGKLQDYTDAAVTGKAQVHGVEGVEILAIQYDCSTNQRMERYFVAQLTDTHCRYLAESHVENGVRKTYTFLDSDIFMNNWGFGKDNCGYETQIRPRGTIRRTGNQIQYEGIGELVDVVGRYTVTFNQKSFDTVCVMDIGHFHHKIAIEQYLDAKGRTVLWRRFNRNDWAWKRYGRLWTEMLPENERIFIQGETFVHWYDCITDYVI